MDTKQLIDYVIADAGIPAPGTYVITGDNSDYLKQQVTGTYVPKELILNLASWISPKFYSKCSNIIIDFYIIDYRDIKDNKLRLIEKLEEIKDVRDRMKQENSKLENQNPTAAPYTNSPKNYNCLVILKKNEPEDMYSYHAIRTHKGQI